MRSPNHTPIGHRDIVATFAGFPLVELLIFPRVKMVSLVSIRHVVITACVGDLKEKKSVPVLMLIEQTTTTALA